MAALRVQGWKSVHLRQKSTNSGYPAMQGWKKFFAYSECDSSGLPCEEQGWNGMGALTERWLTSALGMQQAVYMH